MEKKNILGMVCGYYLSRFDAQAYSMLGFSSHSATHAAIAVALGVKENSIKNWRDEFDPIHDNKWKGWDMREMYSSRKRTVEALGGLSHDEVHSLVSVFLENPEGAGTARIVETLDLDIDAEEEAFVGNLRGVTGNSAEEAFKIYHSKTGLPKPGKLRDCRFDQCGYDFEILDGEERYFVEVKGMAGQQGGISFTAKEWKVAQSEGDKYFLAIARNVSAEPSFSLIANPFEVLNAEMRFYTTIQIDYSVAQSELSRVEANGR